VLRADHLLAGLDHAVANGVHVVYPDNVQLVCSS
jgi:hypothetical protein